MRCLLGTRGLRPRRHGRVQLRAVVCEVSTDKVAGSERGEERKLAGHDSGCDDARELLCVLTGVRGVRTPDTKHDDHGLLGREDSATTDGANFDGGH